MMRMVAVSLCTLNTSVLLLLKMFREVVSIVNPSLLVLLVNLLSLCSLDEHVHSDPLGFACQC
jgi:hypothetical protein